MLEAETREYLQHNANEFERTCEIVGLKLNVGKSKESVVQKDQMMSFEKVNFIGEEMQEDDKFNYLGVMISTDRGVGEEVANRGLREERYGGRWQRCGKRTCYPKK